MDGPMEFSKYREQATKYGSSSRLCYPPELRRTAVAYLAKRRAHGATLAEVSRELGVSESGLHQWVSRQERSTALATFRPVKVVATETAAEAERSSIVVCGPRGLRIEGMSLDEVAELLSRIG